MKKLLALVFALSIVVTGVCAEDVTDEAAKDISTAVTEAAAEVTKESLKYAAEKTEEAVSKIQFPTGTWVDPNWNAEWVFAMGKVSVYDGTNGELVYTFSKDNTDYFDFVPTETEFTLSFACKETNRAYKFTKDMSLDTDLKLFIDPDWTDEDYNVTIDFKSFNVPQN